MAEETFRVAELFAGVGGFRSASKAPDEQKTRGSGRVQQPVGA